MNRVLSGLLLTTAACSGGASTIDDRASGGQASLMKDWAVARCLTKGYGLETSAGADAADSAAALLERGDGGMDAYGAVEKLVDRQLTKPHAGSSGGSFITLKCLELREDPALARLASR